MLRLLLFVALALLLTGCGGGPAATPAPKQDAPTAAPTTVPPTVAPTTAPTTVPTPIPTIPPTVAPTAAPTSAPTAVPPASPASQVDAVARDYFGSRLRQAQLMNLGAYNVATFDITALALNESTAVSQSARDLVMFMPKILAVPEVGVVQLRFYTDRVNGLRPDDVALAFTLSRETASKVDWSAVDPRRLTTLLTATERDGLKVAPALKPAWAAYAQ